MDVASGGQTQRIHWRAAIWAGGIAGVVFLVLELVLWPLAGLGSAWEPIRMIAAILLGPGVLSPPPRFDARILVAALVVHFSLSILYAVIYSALYRWVLRRHLRRLTQFTHGLFGLIIYLINFYGFVALFPWFVEARHGISILVHIAWGMVLPWAYESRIDSLPLRTGRSP